MLQVLLPWGPSNGFLLSHVAWWGFIKLCNKQQIIQGVKSADSHFTISQSRTLAPSTRYKSNCFNFLGQKRIFLYNAGRPALNCTNHRSHKAWRHDFINEPTSKHEQNNATAPPPPRVWKASQWHKECGDIVRGVLARDCERTALGWEIVDELRCCTNTGKDIQEHQRLGHGWT